MPPINLHGDKIVSPLINIDLLSDLQQDIINKSIKAKDIMLLDQDDNAIIGLLSDVNVIIGNNIDTSDIVEENNSLDDLPEIVSVTDDEPEEQETEEFSIPDVYFKHAQVLLKKNGNTVKKTLQAFENTEENLMLLHACLQEEIKDKNRSGVLSIIQSCISEY
jgi:hypothetical protein